MLFRYLKRTSHLSLHLKFLVSMSSANSFTLFVNIDPLKGTFLAHTSIAVKPQLIPQGLPFVSMRFDPWEKILFLMISV